MRTWLILLATSLLAADQPSTAGLAWIAGAWQGKLGPMSIDEIWTAPLEGNMTGMFRMMRASKVSMYELMVIEDTPTGPVLRLRHFNAQLDSRDAQAGEFALIESEAGHMAKFQGKEAGGVVVTLVYRAVENGLEVDFDKTGPKPERVTFQFKRKT